MLAGALALGLLTACGPGPYGLPSSALPEERREARRLLRLALDDWTEQNVRVQRISQRLRLAGRELCGNELSPVLGASVIDLEQVPRELRVVAEERFEADEGLRVAQVFPGMAAERGGLRRGDAVKRVDGSRVRRLTDLDDLDPEGPELRIQVERRGEALELRLPREPGCAFHARLHQSAEDEVNADYERGQIRIHAALLREFPNDEPVALVIGHEFGHGIQFQVLHDHPAGHEAEMRADHLGCYLAARAGLLGDTDALFIGLNRNFNELEQETRSHPVDHRRTLALRAVVEEIERKRAAGEALMPDFQ